MSRSLTDVEYGGEAVVIGLAKCDPPVRQRLFDMGITRGKRIKVLRAAPFGDPLEIIVAGYHLAIRKKEAALIKVED